MASYRYRGKVDGEPQIQRKGKWRATDIEGRQMESYIYRGKVNGELQIQREGKWRATDIEGRQMESYILYIGERQIESYRYTQMEGRWRAMDIEGRQMESYIQRGKIVGELYIEAGSQMESYTGIEWMQMESYRYMYSRKASWSVLFFSRGKI